MLLLKLNRHNAIVYITSIKQKFSWVSLASSSKYCEYAVLSLVLAWRSVPPSRISLNLRISHICLSWRVLMKHLVWLNFTTNYFSSIFSTATHWMTEKSIDNVVIRSFSYFQTNYEFKFKEVLFHNHNYQAKKRCLCFPVISNLLSPPFIMAHVRFILTYRFNNQETMELSVCSPMIVLTTTVSLTKGILLNRCKLVSITLFRAISVFLGH